jgi:hypothetical protein
VVVKKNSRSPRRRSMTRCWSLSCSKRMPPWLWVIAFGKPVVPELNNTHRGMVERNLLALERRPPPPTDRRPCRPSHRAGRASFHHGLGGEHPRRYTTCSRVSSSPPACVPPRGGRRSPAVAVAVNREEHHRLELTEAGRSLRASRTRGRNRTRSLRCWPVATIATMASGMFGRYPTTRCPGRTPSSRSLVATVRTCPAYDSQDISVRGWSSLRYSSAAVPARSAGECARRS